MRGSQGVGFHFEIGSIHESKVAAFMMGSTCIAAVAAVVAVAAAAAVAAVAPDVHSALPQVCLGPSRAHGPPLTPPPPPPHTH